MTDRFAEQVREVIDLHQLRGALVRTAEDAVRPIGPNVWLRNVQNRPKREAS